jgi:sugar transferase (PEP-CTERM/EpsH1 system associated)
VKILFLCHRVPFPPDKGDKIRAFHLLRALAARHDVDLFTLADDPRDLAHQAALQEHCRHVTIARVHPRLARLRSLPHLVSRTPLTIPYFSSDTLQRSVDSAVAARGYDRIFVYCSAMAQYVRWNGAVPVVMDLVDVDSDKWTQYASRTRFPFSLIYAKEGRDLRAYEREVSEKSACVLVTTEREAALAREVAPAARVHVLSNGVDTRYFAPAQEGTTGGAPTLIFTGDMSYFPNREGVTFFAREVLPLVRSAIPDVRFVIVGRNPGRQVEALASEAGVVVTGFVPDVRLWLAQASVAVAPLTIAAGVQNKILEAMSSGLPVVATPRAAQGLTSAVAEVVEIGETADEFAAKCVALIRDVRRARELGQEGRRRVTADYSWEASARRLLDLIDDPRGVLFSPASGTPTDSAGVAASA